MPRDNLALKAKLFRGFADPSRLAVLEALKDGARCVSEVVGITGLSQPNVSAHLSCLEDCGLLTLHTAKARGILPSSFGH